MNTYRILIKCKDAKGLVYGVSKVFFDFDLNIISNSEFVDNQAEIFFMRSVVAGAVDQKQLHDKLAKALPIHADIQVIDTQTKRNIVIMATKESHALGDLLLRYADGELNANVLGVVANHEHLRHFVEKFDLPFFSLSADGMTRETHEIAALELLKNEFPQLDYIVLAKYMRILSPFFVGHFPYKMINIHHSFLPAFIGANPYKQAYERGVKVIGATAHFVTNDLDEGPIIAQSTLAVDHAHSWKQMQAMGRDVEKIVLSNALKQILEDRIFLHGNRTIIL